MAPEHRPAARPLNGLSFAALAAVTVVLHAVLAGAQQQLAWHGTILPAAAVYYAAAAAILVAYVGVIRRVRESPSRRTWMVIVGVPLLLQAGWMSVLPVLAIDAYSYLVDAAHAYAGLNPYEYAVSDAAESDFGVALAQYRWRPVHGVSPYGPVWMNLVAALGPVADDIGIAVRVLKAMALAAVALGAWLIYQTASDGVRTRAFAMFWWNPVLIVEGAGEAHNDAIMMVLVLGSLWCLRRGGTVTAAGALTAAVLTKWIPAFFAPAYLVYSWRRGLLSARTAVAAAATVGGLAVLAYWPFWAGSETFAGIRTLSEPRFIASSTGSVVRLLADYPAAHALLRACAALAMSAAVVYAAFSARRFTDLVRACAVTSLVYVFVAAPMYWAWYVMLPIALLALLDDFALVCVLTATSRFVAPLDVMRLHDTFSWTTEVWLTTVVGLWLPLAYVAWRIVRRLRRSGLDPFGWHRPGEPPTPIV